MRTWQYVGFNDFATALLNEKKVVGHRVITITYFDGRESSTSHEDVVEPTYTKEKYDEDHPWYDNVNTLYIYKFDDGRTYESYVQEEPWSSGPVTFMALRDPATKAPLQESLWTEQQISEAV